MEFEHLWTQGRREEEQPKAEIQIQDSGKGSWAVQNVWGSPTELAYV